MSSEVSTATAAAAAPSSDATATAAADAAPAAAAPGLSADAAAAVAAAGDAVGTSASSASGLTIEEILEKSTPRAQEAKTRGNQYFATKAFGQAIECYSEALALCPPTDTANMAIYYANRAACYLALNQFDAVINDCSASLALTPGYQRALLRRAKAYEAVGKPYDALQDMNAVVAAEPNNSEYVATQKRLQKESDTKFEQQKEEMLGKLKELGNGLLGKFGLSLDNFKATKDPNTGSYSIAFNNGGGGGGSGSGGGGSG